MLNLRIKNLDEINFLDLRKETKMLENLRNIFYKWTYLIKNCMIRVFASLGKTLIDKIMSKFINPYQMTKRLNSKHKVDRRLKVNLEDLKVHLTLEHTDLVSMVKQKF